MRNIQCLQLQFESSDNNIGVHGKRQLSITLQAWSSKTLLNAIQLDCPAACHTEGLMQADTFHTFSYPLLWLLESFHDFCFWGALFRLVCVEPTGILWQGHQDAFNAAHTGA